MNTTRRAIVIARAVFYTLVSSMVIYHVAEALSQNPLTFRIESITIEKDGTHLMHCEIKNESWFPIELEAGGGYLCLPGFDRYACGRQTENGLCMARLASGSIGEYLLVRPGECIKRTVKMPLRLRPGQSAPSWCDGLCFEYTWMPRIVAHVGILLRKPLHYEPYTYTEPFGVFYVPRIVRIPVELPKAVPRS
jgi:hypothetical protein